MAMMFKNPAGATTTYNTIEEIGAAIMERNEIPLRQDGTAMTMVPFNGGILFDGYPLNVPLFGVWYPGQQEALRAAGWEIPAAALSLPIVDPAPAAGGGFDTKQLLLFAAIGFVLFTGLKK